MSGFPDPAGVASFQGLAALPGSEGRWLGRVRGLCRRVWLQWNDAHFTDSETVGISVLDHVFQVCTRSFSNHELPSKMTQSAV